MKKSGFSLVELSIIIVIIGALIGGIMLGRTVIRSSEMRRTLTDLDTYKTALNSFKLKYNCLPGDCAKATSFFGAQNTDPVACKTASSSGTLTCNGNGNGRVEDASYEVYRFWQHLAIAGLIKGKYTGVQGSAGIYHHILDVNAPSTGYPGTGFAFNYSYNVGGSSPSTYSMDYGNFFWLGATMANVNYRPQIGFLTPSEAKDFDKKIDDGLPGKGLVIMRSQTSAGAVAWGNPDACSTSTSASDFTGAYNIATNTKPCSFVIKTNNDE